LAGAAAAVKLNPLQRRHAIPLILGAPWALPAQARADVSLIPVTGDGAGYWSRWRGPSGQGLVTDSGYADKWSSTQNILWSVDLPGDGNSSPIIWDDRIFLTAADRSGERSVLALSRNDGKLLWQTAAPEATPERTHQKNGRASSTVAVDGQRVYAFLGNQGVVAMTLDGKVAWHNDTGPTANYHGPAGSPLLYHDFVIVYQDQGASFGRFFGGQSESFIAAIDRSTGRTAWRKPREASVGWGTPIAIRVNGQDQILVHGQYRVTAYNPANGEEIWTCDGPTMEVIPTPAVGHGLVYCCSGRAGPTLAIRPDGKGDVTDTHIQWRTTRGSPFIPSPLLHDGVLYTVNDMSSIGAAFDAVTGQNLWQNRLGPPMREGFSASPVAVDGKVYFTNDVGQTFVLKAGREFQLLHVNDLGEQVLASPALVDGKWYWRTASKLLALG
jgi:outer membrane protein assembly factor BamB